MVQPGPPKVERFRVLIGWVDFWQIHWKDNTICPQDPTRLAHYCQASWVFEPFQRLSPLRSRPFESFHLVKSMCYFPLLVLKRIYHYWTHCYFFPGDEKANGGEPCLGRHGYDSGRHFSAQGRDRCRLPAGVRASVLLGVVSKWAAKEGSKEWGVGCVGGRRGGGEEGGEKWL